MYIIFTVDIFSVNARNSPDFELESNDFTPQVISEYYTKEQFTSQ